MTTPPPLFSLRLSEAADILCLAGVEFGTSQIPPLTSEANTIIPTNVAEHFPEARPSRFPPATRIRGCLSPAAVRRRVIRSHRLANALTRPSLANGASSSIQVSAGRGWCWRGSTTPSTSATACSTTLRRGSGRARRWTGRTANSIAFGRVMPTNAFCGRWVWRRVPRSR